VADISLLDLFDCVDADPTRDRFVLLDLFGFRRGQVPPDPTGVTSTVSLRQLAEGSMATTSTSTSSPSASTR
jgi:hypothetical protein